MISTTEGKLIMGYLGECNPSKLRTIGTTTTSVDSTNGVQTRTAGVY